MAARTLSQGRHRPCMGLARLRGRAGAKRKRTNDKRAADGDIRFGSEYPDSVGLASVTPVTARCAAGPPGRPWNSADTQDRPASHSHTAVSAAVNLLPPAATGGPCTAAPPPPSARWTSARKTGKQKTALRRFHVVPGTGIEPVRSCPRRILSPLRLPLSPPGQTRIGCLKSPQHGILPSAQIARE